MKFQDQQQYIELYKKKSSYGADERPADLRRIFSLIEKYDLKSVFDYGCGLNQIILNSIKKVMPDFKCKGYDFAVTDDQCTDALINKVSEDDYYDLIVSTDCLEHIPKNELPMVWSIFNSISPKVHYHNISTRLAAQILPDGTNAHKTVESSIWWQNEFSNAFPSYEVIDMTPTNSNKIDYAILTLIKNK